MSAVEGILGENRSQPGSGAFNSLATPATEIDSSAIVQILEQYLVAWEAGQQPNREELLAQYPELAEPLAARLDGLDFISHIAPQLADEQECDPAPPAADPRVKLLGDFCLLREMGRGGMGVVYEAEQISLGRRVALKVLPFAAMFGENRLRRFQNEARVAASLDHPNIVAIHAVGVERGVYHYAMQLISGQSMDRLIVELRNRNQQSEDSHDVAREGLSAIPSREGLPCQSATATTVADHLGISTRKDLRSDRFFQLVARLGIQAAQALHYAHENGILHRDIKPANLLLDVEGHLWITDFGLARLQTDVGLTLSGDVVGTLRYMSPEQARGEGHFVDPRSDIYSLGAALYELLTLQPAFTAHDNAQLLQQISAQEPHAPRSIVHGIPQDLETIVLKTLQKSPHDRYRSAQLLADDLQRFLEQKPVHAQRTSMLQRVGKWMRRHRGLVTTSIMTLMITLAISSVFLWHAMDTSRSALAQSEVNRRQAEANLMIVTGLSRDLANLGMKTQDTDTLREMINVQKRAVDAVTDPAAAASTLSHMLHNIATLTEVLRKQGQLEESHQAAADYWKSFDQYQTLAKESRQAAADYRNRFDQDETLAKPPKYGSLQSHSPGNFAETLVGMGDWEGADRACRRHLEDLIYNRLKQPRSRDDMLHAVLELDCWALNVISKIQNHVADRESLIGEYALWVDEARQLLREQTQPPADDTEAQIIAHAQGYLGNVARFQGHVRESASWYEKAFKSLPHTPSQSCWRNLWTISLLKLADEYRKEGHYRDEFILWLEFVEQSRICADLDPSSVLFFKNLIIGLNVVYFRGTAEESKQACDELLTRLRAWRQHNPDFGKEDTRQLLLELVQLQLVGIYNELYDYPEALTCAEQLLTLDPEKPVAWVLLGMANYRLQDYQGAREWLEKANRPDTAYVDNGDALMARWGLTLTLQKLGELDAARDSYNRVLTAFQEIAEPNIEQQALLKEAQRELAIPTSDVNGTPPR